MQSKLPEIVLLPLPLSAIPRLRKSRKAHLLRAPAPDLLGTYIMMNVLCLTLLKR